MAVLSHVRHGWAVTCHVAVASELAAHGAPQGGVVCEEAGVVDSPHEFLFVGELDVGECCVKGNMQGFANTKMLDPNPSSSVRGYFG